MSDCLRGVIRAYDAGAHVADVELIEGPATVLSAIPVAEPQWAVGLTAGDPVIVLTWPDVGAIVLAAY
jgi:hypothetical protein